MTPYTRQTDCSLVTVNNLTLYRGGNLILRDVNMNVCNVTRPECEQGQVVLLLGRNGRGKTSLAMAMAGLLKIEEPSSGEILIGEDQHPVARGEVGFVFQDYMVYEHLNVKQNLILAANLGEHQYQKRATLMDIPQEFFKRQFHWFSMKKDYLAKAEHYGNLCGLLPYWDKHPKDLSGGTKQRLAICSQILCSQEILFLDEPLSGLDAPLKHDICQLISDVAMLDEFHTTFIISHDTRYAASVADTIYVLGFEVYEDEPECIDKRTGQKTWNFKPGATIVYEPEDLALEGLAWRPDVMEDPKFRELINHLEFDIMPKI